MLETLSSNSESLSRLLFVNVGGTPLLNMLAIPLIAISLVTAVVVLFKTRLNDSPNQCHLASKRKKRKKRKGQPAPPSAMKPMKPMGLQIDKVDPSMATAMRSEGLESGVPEALSRDIQSLRGGQWTVVDVLRYRAATHPEQKVLTFRDDKGEAVQSLSFGELHVAASYVGDMLQSMDTFKRGDRVVLCYPPGLDFAVAFWGCLYAGAVAIPVYPPYPGTLHKDLPKFNLLVSDAGARIALTNKTYDRAARLGQIKSLLGSAMRNASEVKWPDALQWKTTDEALGKAMAKSALLQQKVKAAVATPNLKDLAFFQYSSGSTSTPKAVMISHRNIRAQMAVWHTLKPSDRLLSWLPSYHDMGLVGFIIVPVVTAAPCSAMSPVSFIKNPALWMQLVSKLKATVICAPNFGYALAARKTTDKQRDSLDLSSLRQAICAAEPIRTESLQAFTSKFRPAGFDPAVFNCGYGLAEVTLVLTGQDPDQRKLPVIVEVDKWKLERNREIVGKKVSEIGNLWDQEHDSGKNGASASSQTDKCEWMPLVGCGLPKPGFTVTIVDPETAEELPENRVGEIWACGDSVAEGYWGQEEMTRAAFHNQIRSPRSAAARGLCDAISGRGAAGNDGTGDRYLRTGDLGFIRDGEIFVTGRIKDLIIVRGRNIAPQDVELTIEESHPEIRPGCSAAFSVDIGQEEKLVVVAETRRSQREISEQELKAVASAVRTGILSAHQITCHAVVLIAPRSIAKTTSGKIQRSRCKTLFNTEGLKILWKDENPAPGQCVLTKSQMKRIARKRRLNRRKQTESASAVSEIENTNTNTISVPSASAKTKEGVETWLVDKIKHILASQEHGEALLSSVDGNTSWSALGLDSISLVGLSSELGEWLGHVVPPAAFLEYESPAALARAPGLLEGEMEMSTCEMPDTVGQCGVEHRDPEKARSDVKAEYEISQFPEFLQLQHQINSLKSAGLTIPYLAEIDRNSRRVNYNTYNYLGLAGHPRVREASKRAIDDWGTTMSSSPIVGQNSLNIALEKELAKFLDAEAAVCFIGGWQTNVSVVDVLVGKGDLILSDSLNHNCLVVGQRLSGATVIPFPHNNWRECERILSKLRGQYRRVLILVEGVYSMDGDLPEINKFIEMKKKYQALLLIDEAHSIGTIGATGRGILEEANVDRRDVDVVMGTMSKALGSQGGFIVGCQALIDLVKFTAGGFVFSVGMSPPNAASALESLRMLQEDPTRVQRLQRLSKYFHGRAKAAGLNVGESRPGTPVVPIIIGKSAKCARVSQGLREHDVDVKPIIHPAVEEGQARLRFFISSLRTEEELDRTVDLMVKQLDALADRDLNPAAA